MNPLGRAALAGHVMLLTSLAIGAAATPPALTAQARQTTQELIAQRRLEHRAALDAHQAALSSFRAIEQQFTSALADITRARTSGNEDALASLRARFHELSVPRADREARVNETSARVDVTRRDLIDALIIRQSELIGLLDGVTSNTRRQTLNAELDDVSNQITELETQEGGSDAVMATVMPNIDFSPRDTPADRIRKAEILERHAAVVDTVILDNDAQIDALEVRLRNERRRQLFLTDRFGDRIVPTGPPRGDPAVQVGDSTGAGGRPVTLEDRIAALRTYRERLVEYRDRLLIRAQQFRQSIRRRS